MQLCRQRARVPGGEWGWCSVLAPLHPPPLPLRLWGCVTPGPGSVCCCRAAGEVLCPGHAFTSTPCLVWEESPLVPGKQPPLYYAAKIHLSFTNGWDRTGEGSCKCQSCRGCCCRQEFGSGAVPGAACPALLHRGAPAPLHVYTLLLVCTAPLLICCATRGSDKSWLGHSELLLLCCLLLEERRCWARPGAGLQSPSSHPIAVPCRCVFVGVPAHLAALTHGVAAVGWSSSTCRTPMGRVPQGSVVLAASSGSMQSTEQHPSVPASSAQGRAARSAIRPHSHPNAVMLSPFQLAQISCAELQVPGFPI